MEGKLELEGDIGEAIRVCDELSEALLVDSDQAPPQRLAHDKSTDAEAISYHYDVSNAFYHCGSIKTWSIRVPTSASRTTHSIKPSRTSSTICAANYAMMLANTYWMWAVAGAGCRVLLLANTAPKCSASP